MNHGPAFQALWKQLRNDVRNLQNKGYYGDGTPSFFLPLRLPLPMNQLIDNAGYWSSGSRLADSSKIKGQGIEAGDFPEYMVRTPLLVPYA